MIDWLIIGGGVHGTHLSHVLVTSAGVPRARVRVLDPHDEALACWSRVTASTGMRYLRSPGVHHVDIEALSLLRFARRGAARRVARFARPYERPGLALFQAHARAVVITEHRLDSLRIETRATSIERHGGGFAVTTTDGRLEARRVILAIGLGEQPCWPAWARETAAQRGAIEHVFSPSFKREDVPRGARVAVVGGGISAAQSACALARAGCDVALVARHPVRVQRFDSDPAWLGPKAMRGFSSTRDPALRRQMITEARHRGSMPPEILAQLRRELQRGRVSRRDAEVVAAVATRDAVRLTLSRGDALVVDRVLLATGFDAHRPGAALVDDAIERLGLPCAACGYPLISPALEWAPGLHVSGPLAELELGPTARNIAGARAAGERLRRVG